MAHQTLPPFMAAPQPRRRWLKILLAVIALTVLLIGAALAAGGWDILKSGSKPDLPFEAMKKPPAPDYAKPNAWLAFPGRNGLERSTPPGFAAINEDEAPADVFFIHPTTFRGNPVWNIAFDASNEEAVLKAPVLLQQVSVFNGCCRLYAPQYRQATIAGLSNPEAFALAYSDVAAAFRYYIEHYNDGRPFILASHSQGTGHANRLMQEEILGKPIKAQMVAAYMIGGYVPDTFTKIGLPTCDDALQTGCVISYNASQQGRSGARMILKSKGHWWQGKLVEGGSSNAICVNPLTWTQDGAAPAASNPGSHPFPQPPFKDGAAPLAVLAPKLTGAKCNEGMLEVDIPWSAPDGFSDKLTLFFGSHHLNDFGLFYAAIRENAIKRIEASKSKHVDRGSH